MLSKISQITTGQFSIEPRTVTLSILYSFWKDGERPTKPNTPLTSSSVIVRVTGMYRMFPSVAVPAVIYLLEMRKNLTPKYPFGGPDRQKVPDDQADWAIDASWYCPPKYTSEHVLTKKKFADPEIIVGKSDQFKWNAMDGNVNRISHTGPYIVHESYPLNPAGRTGMTGRGHLGKWAVNHAADTIVTRLKRNETGCIVCIGGKPVGQFIAIQRKDTGDWAIPGGSIDPGEDALTAAKREFYEEVFNSDHADEAEMKELEQKFSELLATPTAIIYQGYVDDRRNTDNAWLETEAIHYHGNSEKLIKILAEIKFKAGSDARDAAWLDISSNLTLYASHRDIIKRLAEKNSWHW